MLSKYLPIKLYVYIITYITTLHCNDYKHDNSNFMLYKL